MKKVLICMAGPGIGDRQPTPVEITIAQPFPQLTSELEYEKWHQVEADRIVDALSESLPRATLERVFYGLMSRRLSLYQGIMGS